MTVPGSPARTRNDRLLAVARLYFVNPWTAVYWPWLILAFVLLLDVIVWISIRSAVPPDAVATALEATGWSGASFFFFIYMMVLAVQAITTTFPFAQGWGITRREFYLSTSVAFSVLAVVYGAAFTLLAFIEDLTGGWGLGGRMFTVYFFGEGDWYQRLFLFVIAFAFFLFAGMASAAAYVRWRTAGAYVFWGAVSLLLVGAVAVITAGQSWPAIIDWLARTGPYGIAAWMLLPTVASGLLGYRILRGATPRS